MKHLLSLLLALSFGLSFAQNKTYFGVEFGPKFEIYQYTDNGSDLYTKPFLYQPIYGFTIGHEINNTIIGETGVYINDYGESYRINGDFGYGISNAILAYQIPLRLKARFNLVKEQLKITTTIGYTFAVNSEYGSSGSGSSFTSTSGLEEYNKTTRTENISNYSLRKNYGLIETGIALEYEFNNSFTLSLATNSLRGFNKIVEIDVKYWIENQAEQTGKVFSNGDYYSIVLGLKYPISNFWTKKTKL